MTIKLSELKAIRAAMTQGDMFYDGGDALMVQPRDGATELLGDIGENMCCEDVDGIVATHNAADVMWEIVDSELAIVEARKTAAEAFRALQHAYSPGGRCMVTADEEARLIGNLAVCDLAIPHEEARHAAALAKVIR